MRIIFARPSRHLPGSAMRTALLTLALLAAIPCTARAQPVGADAPPAAPPATEIVLEIPSLTPDPIRLDGYSTGVITMMGDGLPVMDEPDAGAEPDMAPRLEPVMVNFSDPVAGVLFLDAFLREAAHPAGTITVTRSGEAAPFFTICLEDLRIQSVYTGSHVPESPTWSASLGFSKATISAVREGVGGSAGGTVAATYEGPAAAP